QREQRQAGDRLDRAHDRKDGPAQRLALGDEHGERQAEGDANGEAHEGDGEVGAEVRGQERELLAEGLAHDPGPGSASALRSASICRRGVSTSSRTKSSAGAAASAAGVATCTSLPARMTATRSPMISASLMSWVTMTVVTPSARAIRK